MSFKKGARLACFGFLLLLGGIHAQTSAQQVTRDDEWVFTTSYGIPVWIAFNDVTKPQMLANRKIFIFIEAQNFTAENIRKLFTNMATEHKQPDWLYITAFSDKQMLQRAINTSTAGAIIDWADTPEGREAAKKWAEQYEPLPTGYFRARYSRISRKYYSQSYFEEEYSYSPDAAKTEMARVVLQEKPKLSPYTGNLNSDLLIATREGDAKKVGSLVDEGADVNTREQDGDTPLMIASLRGKDLEIVKALVAKGADVNAKNHKNGTALIYAASNKDAGILQVLLDKGAGINHQNDAGYSALIMAAVADYRLEPLKTLLARGADTELKNDSGDTALTVAAAHGAIETARALLRKGANVNATGGNGDTPLIKAAATGKVELVKFLIEKGADVNARNKNGVTSLMVSRDRETTLTLLSKGADVNAKDQDDATALMYAVQRSVVDKAKLLLESGADLKAKNRAGKTAIDIANKGYGNNNAMLDVLESAETKVSEAGPNGGSTGPPQLVLKRDPKAQCCEEVSSVAFSPDGKLVASKLYHSSFGGNHGIVFWELNTGGLKRSIEGPPHGVIPILFSPDGREIASEYGKVWDAESGKPLSVPGISEDAEADTAAYSVARSASLVASAGKRIGERNIIALRDAKTGMLYRSFATDAPVTELKLGSDGRRLAGVIRQDGAIAIWDANTGDLIRKIRLVGPGFYDLAYSNDGKMLAASYGDTAREDFADVFDPNTGNALYRLNGHSSVVFSLAFSSDGKLLASGSGDSTIKLWETASGKLLRTLEGHTEGVRSVRFSPDNSLLASGGGKNETKIWSMRTGKLLVTFQSFNDGNWIAYTPDGYYNCSEGASKYIAWRVGNRVLEEPKYDAQFHRPEIVAERLRD